MNCPACGKVLELNNPGRVDLATGKITSQQPGPNDSTICHFCFATLVFNDDMSLRILTPEAALALPDKERMDLYKLREKLMEGKAQKELLAEARLAVPKTALQIVTSVEEQNDNAKDVALGALKSVAKISQKMFMRGEDNPEVTMKALKCGIGIYFAMEYIRAGGDLKAMRASIENDITEIQNEKS